MFPAYGLKITVTGDIDATIQSFLEIAETLEMGVQVGHIDVSEEMAMKSQILEHRHQGGSADYKTPGHWDTSDKYITWAFAARTAKSIEDKMLPNLVKRLARGEVTGKDFWEFIGDRGVEMMQNTMEGVSRPGNAPSTIRQKGEDNPLIHTGEMKRSVSYKVMSADELEQSTQTVEHGGTEVPYAF